VSQVRFPTGLATCGSPQGWIKRLVFFFGEKIGTSASATRLVDMVLFLGSRQFARLGERVLTYVGIDESKTWPDALCRVCGVANCGDILEKALFDSTWHKGKMHNSVRAAFRICRSSAFVILNRSSSSTHHASNKRLRSCSQ
jgi:hypothetical protein